MMSVVDIDVSRLQSAWDPKSGGFDKLRQGGELLWDDMSNFIFYLTHTGFAISP